MGHHITGRIARREVLKQLSGRFADQPPFALAESLAFMPLDCENLDEITGAQAKAVGELVYLTERLIELVAAASRIGAIAYIETGYHGGSGGQGATVFCSCKGDRQSDLAQFRCYQRCAVDNWRHPPHR